MLTDMDLAVGPGQTGSIGQTGSSAQMSSSAWAPVSDCCHRVLTRDTWCHWRISQTLAVRETVSDLSLETHSLSHW